MRVLRDKKIFDVISNVDIIEHLPVANYEIKFGAFGRIFLEETDNVIIPKKVYSNDTDFIQHVLHTWKHTENVMGVGLVGKKGLGKSFTGNIIAQEAGVPIIRLLGVAPNSNLFGFLNKIEQDFVLFIDEFEKNFEKKRDNDSGLISQEDFLTFLDNGGGRKNRILLITTANDKYAISDFLKNRPSRLRYYKEYNRLEDNIIQEIITDLLKDKTHQADLLKYLPYEDLNIDVLIKIIQEINLHNKPYSTFKSFFNYKRETSLEYEIYMLETEKSEPVKLSTKLSDREYLYSGTNLGKTPNGINVFLEEDIDLEKELLPLYEASMSVVLNPKKPFNSTLKNVKVTLKPVMNNFEYLF